MSERPSENLGGMEIDLARRIDEVCRRFEVELREGRRPSVEDYAVEISDEARPALRAELEALERELRPLDEKVARPASVPPTAPEPPTALNPSTVAEQPTIAPGPPPSSVHDEATVPPSETGTTITANSCAKVSTISSRRNSAASIAAVSNGFTGNERCPWGISHSEPTLMLSRASHSAPTESGSPLPVVNFTSKAR
jgi:hypothetical protein